jgi:hypothetical protein
MGLLFLVVVESRRTWRFVYPALSFPAAVLTLFLKLAQLEMS